jgi:hypothetical protein
MAVAMRDRQAGRSSIRGVRPLYYMIKVTVALVLSLIKEGPSSREGGAEG